jgi:hypothetical protein
MVTGVAGGGPCCWGSFLLPQDAAKSRMAANKKIGFCFNFMLITIFNN